MTIRRNKDPNRTIDSLGISLVVVSLADFSDTPLCCSLNDRSIITQNHLLRYMMHATGETLIFFGNACLISPYRTTFAKLFTTFPFVFTCSVAIASLLFADL